MKTLYWICGTAVTALLLGISTRNSDVMPLSSVRADDKTPPAALVRADEISEIFRSVAKRTLPAVVSIEAVGRTRPQSATRLDGSFGTDPFSDHPFLKEFFGRIPEGLTEPESGVPQRRSVGQGSGFIIDPSGLIMTNAHVVRGADEVKVQLSDGRVVKATDVKTDDRADVAVLRIQTAEQLPFLTLGDDEQMEIGDLVMAFGSPFGLHRTVTQGIISAKSRGLNDSRMRQEFIQTDAAINPGNSGGPLVNLRGEVIGINTAISTSSGGYDGVGFAVPVSLARWVGDQLAKNGKVRRAYLGIVPQDINADMAEALRLDSPHGVLVAEVSSGSPADKAGLQIQDVIVQLNGQEITNARKLVAVAEKLTIGQQYAMNILRNGESTTLMLTVAELPARLVAEETENIPESDSSEQSTQPGAFIEELGAQIEPLTDELAQQLKVQNTGGVVVTSIRRGGLAATLGIQPGTIIMRIGNSKVNSIADVQKSIAAAKTEGQVLFYLKTSNGSQFISVPLNERD
jgi:serine protease Do